MNVALFAPRFSPSFDGVGDHGAFVTESLTRAGHDVVVITEASRARPRCDVVRVRAWNVRALFTVLFALRGRRIDLALFNYTPFNFGSRTIVPHVLAAFLRLRGIRVATFMHEGFYRPRGTNPMPVSKALFLGLRDLLMTALSNAVFAASRERAAAIAAVVPFFRDRIHVLPIGANVEPPATQHWSPPDAAGYRVVTFGVVAPRRRIELAIRMIAAGKRRGIAIELAVIGRVFDESYVLRCETLARYLDVADRVRFTHELDPEDVTSLLMGAHLAIHALFEGAISSSGSLLAVLSHGVPLLAVRTERDERAYDEFAAFTSEDPDEMLDAALEIFRSPDGGAALGRRARGRYERDYAWDSIAQRAIEIPTAGTKVMRHARA